MLSVAMLAMVLAAVAPAFGQGDIGDVNEGDDQFNVGDETIYSAVCQNILGSFQAGAGAGAGAGFTVTAGPTNSVSATASPGTPRSTPGPTADPGAAGVTQGGLGFAFAVGGDNAAAAAEIAQEQNVSVEQVNECLNAFASAAPAANGGGGAAAAQYGGGGGGGSASASASATATALPATGGMVPSSALALGAGALLVGGGLLARRIVR